MGKREEEGINKSKYREYIQGLALTEGVGITQTPCMFPKCTAKLTEKDFEELALPSSLQRYLSLIPHLPFPLSLSQMLMVVK